MGQNVLKADMLTRNVSFVSNTWNYHGLPSAGLLVGEVHGKSADTPCISHINFEDNRFVGYQPFDFEGSFGGLSDRNGMITVNNAKHAVIRNNLFQPIGPDGGAIELLGHTSHVLVEGYKLTSEKPVVTTGEKCHRETIVTRNNEND